MLLADLAKKYQVNTKNINKNNAKQIGKVWAEVNKKINAEIKAQQTDGVTTDYSVDELNADLETLSDMATKKTTFAKQIDDVIKGIHNPRYDLYVSETPEIYTKLGFADSALLMRNSKVAEILKKHPEMSVEMIKKIPEAIQQPILVLKSKTHPMESVVAITDIKTDKGNMIVPIWLNQEGTYIDIDLGIDVNENTNFVSTAYGRNLKSLLEYANENEGFLYQTEKTEKVRQLLARNGLQLPTPLKLSDFNINISQRNNDVNNNISQNDVEYSKTNTVDTDTQRPKQYTNNAIEVDGNVFFTDEADSTFTEPSASSPKDASPLQRAIAEKYGSPLLTEDQKTIKEIGKKLGLKILFDNVYVKDAQGNKVLDKMNRPIRANAEVDLENRTITIDYNCKKPVEFLIKHELTDYMSKNRAVFFDLMNTVMDSGEFSEWVKSKNFASTKDMVADIIEKRLAAGDPNFVGKSDEDLEIEANIEMTSDFIGEKCFGGPKSLDGLLEALQPEQRKTFIQRFLDFLRSIRDRIAGNKTLEDDITRIEKQFVKAYRVVEVSQQQKNTDQMQ